MRNDELARRTRAFALRIIRLCEALPSRRTANTIANQLIRSGTSVGANYRAACRARSRADFVAKMGIVEEECDESLYWLDLLIESGLVKADRLADLIQEANAILSMAVASIKTARMRNSKRPKT